MNTSRNDFDEDLGGEEYDLFPLAVPYHDKMEEEVAKTMGTFASSHEDSSLSVLDIGCGTGITAKLVLDTDSRINIVGLDGSAKMLARAAENLHTYADRVTFVKDDALVYLQKQKAASIDAIITVFALHNNPIEYRRNVFAESHRIMRRGGLFVTGDKIAQDDLREHQQAFAYDLSCLDKFDEMGRPDQKHAWLKHYAHDDTPEYRQTEREVATELANAGFSNVQKTFRLYMDAVVTARKR